MYDLGDTVALAVDIKTAAGVLTAPSSITLTITLPDGTTATPTPATATTGKYTVDYVPSVVGHYRAVWAAVTPTAAYTTSWNVDEGNGIISVQAAKRFLNIDETDTTYDEELRDHIAGVIDVVEDIVGAVARRTHVEKHSGGRQAIALNRHPVLSVTSVTESGVTVASTGYSLSDQSILTRVSGYLPLRWAFGVDNVVATYVVGRQIIAPSILQASKDLIRINFRPQQGGNYSPFDSGGAPQDGSWRLGFFLPHGVMRQLQAHARPPGQA